jgi:cytochrome c peroxidase
MSRTTFVLALLLATTACSPDLRASVAAAGVFSPRRVEVGNDELAQLGQLLFFDHELSGNRNIACGTCHMPPQHAVDGRHLSVGQDGERLSRSAIEPFNRGSATALLWDGRVARVGGAIVAPVALPDGIETLLQAQALLPLLDRREMRGQPGDASEDGRANELADLPDDAPDEIWAAIVARVVAIEGYRSSFARAFPDVPIEEITIVHVVTAIAAFEARLWELTDTAFDDYLGSVSEPGNDAALGAPERRGAELFFGEAGCAHCHDGPLLSDGGFHNIGVPQIGPGRDDDHLDEGRFLVTGDEGDRFAFRTPPLRNVALTGPYMHDGAYASLDEAVRHHLDPIAALERFDGSQLPDDLRSQVRLEASSLVAASIDPDLAPERALGEDDIAAILAFLNALTSRTELSLPPGAGIPAQVPSGLPVDSPRFTGDTLDD